ncbi:MAG: hypothetical protein F4Y01_09225 [Gammaproteobacteria bacterium]|nr:hypothetical protein [Gammaproteobacteria bacterium]
MKRTLCTLAVATALALAAPATQAHHAFGAEFDPNRPILIKGPVVKIEWTNPHAWFHVEHTNEDGTKTVWMMEAGTPNTLLRRGIHRNSVPVGTEVVIDGYQSKDLSKRGNGRNMTFANGQSLFMGSSGTGAPRDGADPTEPPRRQQGESDGE